ncbi:DUF2513 domain-containing protein [Paenibacillus sp. NAIST15-1]|uniref:DUF2513 domain-containing protein n=1 Tax=Paenibacillus sp. NAIST15-1 TaxID=1605994 RepID=UPI00086A5551|nr:DUF2513 domain-containing protein [Paenibacillus sp. NAIST15-1]GAV11419.1 hypothetical protein PBN151_1348 [Paenibacillus sp. NAIST15-1]
MKRDMELIIEILKVVESKTEPFIMSIEGKDYGLVQYNVGLAVEHGLIVASSKIIECVPTYLISGLTWDGHEFLDSVKNEGVLEKAKSLAKEKGSKLYDLPFEILKGVFVKAATLYYLGS